MALIKTLEKEQIDEIIQEIYLNFEKESGSVPEWVKVMAYRPEILKEFLELFKVIMNKGEIESFLKWKIAYVVSETLKCEFCVSVTSGMLKRLGATEEVLSDIKEKKNQEQKEKEILELVKDVTLDGYLNNPKILENLKKKLTESELVELISVVGLFNYINRFNNTFAILPN
jgi:uncharacterized peroxidase-related enzyme